MGYVRQRSHRRRLTAICLGFLSVAAGSLCRCDFDQRGCEHRLPGMARTVEEYEWDGILVAERLGCVRRRGFFRQSVELSARAFVLGEPHFCAPLLLPFGGLFLGELVRFGLNSDLGQWPRRQNESQHEGVLVGPSPYKLKSWWLIIKIRDFDGAPRLN